MKRCKVILGVTMLLAWLAPMALAQGESGTAVSEIDPKRTTRLTLGSTSGAPGTSVVVPLYITPAEGVQVGSLELIVEFISANLKFNRLDPGMATEIGKLSVQAEVKQGKNDKGVDTSTLKITAAMRSSSEPETGFPSGLLAYLTFRADDDARPASIKLRTTAKANELKTNNPIQNLQIVESTVDVVDAGDLPVVTCFFFTH